MFPGLSGFHWDAGHIIFLGAFYLVALAIACTLAASAWRAVRDSVPRRAEAIRWHCNFSELTSADRRCRHELAGEIARRECPNEFDCRCCAEHPNFVQRTEGPMAEAEVQSLVSGIPVPHDRLYHRGHSWAKRELSGDYTVGLDAFATRLIGSGYTVDLPEPGSEVFVNGTAFTVHQEGDSFRVLSPVAGNVVAAEQGEHGWILRVCPEPNLRTDHLLSGRGAAAWMAKEIERLQLAYGGSMLADGGELSSALIAESPQADWSSVRARMLLNT